MYFQWITVFILWLLFIGLGGSEKGNKRRGQSVDEIAAATLLRITYAAALRSADKTYLTRRRRIQRDVFHKKDESTEDMDINNMADPRNLYEVTVPNDIFRIREDDREKEEAYLPNVNPHRVVQNAQNMETNVDTLLASANSLKTQSIQLQSKAAELEKQAELLHANAGGPVVHSMDKPITEADVAKPKDGEHAEHTEHLEHVEHTEHPEEKCCQSGEGPERGGFLSRVVKNGQLAPGGVIKAPPLPTLGPPSYEKGPPIRHINSGYPMYKTPPQDPVEVPEVLKPNPPLFGNNPYEVLTSASLNGTAYKTQPFDSPHYHQTYSQKYVISLKDLKKQKEKTVKADNKSLNLKNARKRDNSNRANRRRSNRLQTFKSKRKKKFSNKKHKSRMTLNKNRIKKQN